MNMEHIKQALLSQPAILIYEILLFAALLALAILLLRKRKRRKKIQATAQERQAKKSLDDSLSNQRRR